MVWYDRGNMGLYSREKEEEDRERFGIVENYETYFSDSLNVEKEVLKIIFKITRYTSDNELK